MPDVTLCARPPYQDTEWDRGLLKQAVLWRGIYRAGGPARLGNKRYLDRGWYDWASIPPWRSLPSNGKRIHVTQAITRPSVENVDVQVLSYRVPVGWDGVISSVVHLFTGSGFSEASGDLVWRVKVNRWWLKNLDAVTVTMGSLQFPYELEGGGYRIYSGEDVSVAVSLGTGATGRLDPQGRVVCSLAGWIYPLI